MPSRLVIRLSGSLKGCRGAIGIHYACCRSVLTVGQGLRFRRYGQMDGVIGVFCGLLRWKAIKKSFSVIFWIMASIIRGRRLQTNYKSCPVGFIYRIFILHAACHQYAQSPQNRRTVYSPNLPFLWRNNPQQFSALRFCIFGKFWRSRHIFHLLGH